MLKITEEMRESARKLLKTASSPQSRPWASIHSWGTSLPQHEHKLLTAIANGERKQIDERWWKEIHHVVSKDKLYKLEQLADPERNDNPHERDLASAKLAEFKARRPPGMRPEPRPLPKTWEEWEEAKRRATEERKRARAKNKAGAVNVTKAANITRPCIADRPAPVSQGTPEASTTDSVATRARLVTDSVAVKHSPTTNSVAAAKRHSPPTDSVAKGWLARRTAAREQARAGLKCRTCNAPLNAQRPTARFCSSTCRSKAFRSKTQP